MTMLNEGFAVWCRYIELVKPVYHVGMYSKIVQVLRSVCFFCSKVIVRHLILFEISSVYKK